MRGPVAHASVACEYRAVTVRDMPLPRTPVVLSSALDDPSQVWKLIDNLGPYWPVQRYLANAAEYAAMSGDSEPKQMFIAPVFRGNWTQDGVALPGVGPVLDDPRFADAAATVFGAQIVRPTTVYVNLTWQMPFPQGRGHTDVPAFHGFDRDTYPITFLTLMGLSGLFEDVRVKVATAVCWLYEGADGGFEYWPEGPDGPSVVHEGAINNTAIVADNDFMWHRARATGRAEDGLLGLSRDAELQHRGDGSWAIHDGGTDVAVFGSEKLRVSLSWKALTFADEADRRRHDEHTDDIDLAGVLARFAADFAAAGEQLEIPDDPHNDAEFIRQLSARYVRYPATTAAT